MLRRTTSPTWEWPDSREATEVQRPLPIHPKISATRRDSVARCIHSGYTFLSPLPFNVHSCRASHPTTPHTLLTPTAAKRRPGAALRRNLLTLESLAKELACASHPRRPRPRRSGGNAGDNGRRGGPRRAASTVYSGGVSRSGRSRHTERVGRVMHRLD